MTCNQSFSELCWNLLHKIASSQAVTMPTAGKLNSTALFKSDELVSRGKKKTKSLNLAYIGFLRKTNFLGHSDS